LLFLYYIDFTGLAYNSEWKVPTDNEAEHVA
jgi:hypothetical protein